MLRRLRAEPRPQYNNRQARCETRKLRRAGFASGLTLDVAEGNRAVSERYRP